MAVFIDGVRYEGNNVGITGDGKVFVNGKEQPGNRLSGVVEVRIVEGTPVSLTTDASVHCGEVAGEVRAGGSVSCGAVKGNVSAGGSVKCGNVGGDVSAGGSITAQRVSGDASAGGSIRAACD